VHRINARAQTRTREQFVADIARKVTGKENILLPQPGIAVQVASGGEVELALIDLLDPRQQVDADQPDYW
jgi:hypothetical protein